MKDFGQLLLRWTVGIAFLILAGCQTHVSVPPQPIFQAQPEYPLELRRAGITGQVVVGFVVGVDGVPLEAFAFSSTNRALEAPAIEAVMKWRFKPATVDGRPVNTKMKVPIIFSLEN